MLSFDYLERFFRNLAETDKKLGFFGIKNHKIDSFFNFFITKSSNFISNMNDDFYEASFEVYYIFVRQKLAILGFSPKIFFILTSAVTQTLQESIYLHGVGVKCLLLLPLFQFLFIHCLFVSQVSHCRMDCKQSKLIQERMLPVSSCII